MYFLSIFFGYQPQSLGSHFIFFVISIFLRVCIQQDESYNAIHSLGQQLRTLGQLSTWETNDHTYHMHLAYMFVDKSCSPRSLSTQDGGTLSWLFAEILTGTVSVLAVCRDPVRNLNDKHENFQPEDMARNKLTVLGQLYV